MFVSACDTKGTLAGHTTYPGVALADAESAAVTQDSKGPGMCQQQQHTMLAARAQKKRANSSMRPTHSHAGGMNCTALPKGVPSSA
jgi:hypothetical protein